MRRLARHAARLAALALLAAGAAQAGAAAWMPLKAALGQHLLARAWEETRATGAPARPWGWADIAPLARIEVPRLGVAAVVLSDASGEAMAWGPGHVRGTALPGAPGLSAIAGHRDSHLAFLAGTRPGDEIWVETADGRRLRFRAAHAQVVDARVWRFPAAGAGRPRLALATCWPFGSDRPGPLRFVLFAEPEDPVEPAPGTPA